MKNRFFYWMFFSGLSFVFGFGSIVLFEEPAFDMAEVFLEPWFVFCRYVTPLSWQTLGNIPLGLSLLVTGLGFYSMLVGAICVIVMAIMRLIVTGLFPFWRREAEEDIATNSTQQ